MKAERSDPSHRGKKKSPRLVAGTKKALAVTAEKQRGQAFLRKLRAEGVAWWTTPSGTRCKVKSLGEAGYTTYDNVLAVIGNRLRVGMIADKSGTMIVGNEIEYDAYDYIPRNQILGLVIEMHGKNGATQTTKDLLPGRLARVLNARGKPY